jgi:hypothetical protein
MTVGVPDLMTDTMPRSRPFKLADAMILVASAAVWMTLMRTQWNQLQMVMKAVRKGIFWQGYVGTFHNALNTALFMLALAYLVIRLIPPRPSRSDLIRQPGMLFLGLMIALPILLLLLSGFVLLVPWTNVIIALALGLSWLAACRRYRSLAESGWIEGIGRSVVVGLVVSTAATYPLYLFV